ncbi:MAG: hypothetical protein V3R25_05530, partial [Nitrosomonadaceae bacterium]
MKLMRLFILICCITLLSGCSRSGDALLCKIEGKPFQGIFPLVKDSAKTTKVLMVHGVAKHEPGYSTQLLDGLANKMGLNQISEITKNITLTDPLNSAKKLGNLRIRQLSNEDKDHKLVFYELTWSEINNGRKKILAYDMSGDYAFHRAFVNEKIKRITNDFIPDQMLYVGGTRTDILTSFIQAFCWMVSMSWDDLPVTANQACGVADLLSANVSMKKDHYAFISHSLGSRIIIDGLQRISAKLSDKESKRRKLLATDEFIQAFQQLRLPIFMLANQLPLFQVTRETPEITGQHDAYCRAEGEHYNLRTLSDTDIIAFNDPNDILSYTITKEFMDRYLDSRLCIDTTNININVADITGAFGIDYANPFDAHNGYET